MLIKQVSCARGTITSYALMSLEPRGTLFVTPGLEVITNYNYRCSYALKDVPIWILY